MKYVLVILLLVSKMLFAVEQDGEITDGIDFVGTLVDENHNPISFATVRLLRADSSFVKAALTNEHGDFLIRTQVPPGSYLLAFSSLEYQREMVEVNLSSDGMFMISTIVMRRLSKELSEAVVVGQRRYLEQQANKTIINVESNQTAAASNAWELLQGAPGVILDRQTGLIRLQGRSGVKVLINGRSLQCSNEQMAEMLVNISGSSISKIEINSTPSAINDADAAGGIISIQLKRPINEGTNGDISMAGGMGECPRAKTSLLLNHHRSRSNIFADFSWQYDRYVYNETGTRTVTSMTASSQFVSGLTRYRTSTPISLRFGGDVMIDTNNYFSYAVHCNTAQTRFTNASFNEITTVGNSKSVRIEQDAVLIKEGTDVLVNCNYEHRFAELQSSLQMNVDWFLLGFLRDNEYKGRNLTEQSNWTYNNPISNKLQLVTVQVDYKYPLSQHNTLMIGEKSMFTKRLDDSQFRIFQAVNSTDVLPFDQQFQFNELIQALYTQLETKHTPKLQSSFGLRSEYLHRAAQINAGAESKQTDEIQLFPSASLSYSAREGWQYSLSYSRQILRPSYRNLSPMRIYSDPFTSMYGNPSLKPQIDNNVSLIATIYKYLTLTPRFTLSQNMFVPMLYQNDTTGMMRTLTENMRLQYSYSLLTSFSKPITKWWNLTASVTLGYDDLHFKYNQLDYTKQLWWNLLQFQSQWQLPKNWSVQCDAWRVGQVNQGFYNIKALGSASLSVRKTIGSTSISLQINDILHSFTEHKWADFYNYHYQTNGSSDTRQVWLTVKHRFGNNKVTKSKKRGYDVSDIKQRAGE